MCVCARYRTRATLSPLLSFFPIPLSVFVFLSGCIFPMGNVVTFQSLWKPGRIEMETHPSPIDLLHVRPSFSLNRCFRRAFSSSPPLSLSLYLLCVHDRARAFHLSLIQPTQSQAGRQAGSSLVSSSATTLSFPPWF